MKHTERQTLSRSEIAERLRRLADQFEAGTLHLGHVEGSVPDRANEKLQYEVEGGKGELELEIEWYS